MPYGGVHRGVDGYVRLMKEIGELFNLDFETLGLYALDDELVLLRMIVTFTSLRQYSIGSASGHGAPASSRGPREAK